MSEKPTVIRTHFQHLPVTLNRIVSLQQQANDHFSHVLGVIHRGHIGALGGVVQSMNDLLVIVKGGKNHETD